MRGTVVGAQVRRIPPINCCVSAPTLAGLVVGASTADQTVRVMGNIWRALIKPRVTHVGVDDALAGALSERAAVPARANTRIRTATHSNPIVPRRDAPWRQPSLMGVRQAEIGSD